MSRVSQLLILSLALGGCGDFASSAPFGGADSGADGPTDVPGMAGDAGVSDSSQGAFADSGAGPAPGYAGFPGFAADPGYNAGFTTGESRDGDAADPSTRLSCFDGLDNDGSLVADCSDPACQALGSCCVGRGDCCVDLDADTSPLPASLDVSSCAGTDGAACVATLTTKTVEGFGFPGSFLDHGALAPGGDASGDAGLLLGDSVDLRTHALTLEADLMDAEECGVSCLESVAFGVVADRPVGRVVRPMVALLSSPSLAQVRLIIGDEVVKTFSTAGLAPATPTHWTLSLNPEGRVHVSSDIAGMESFEAPFAANAAARVVVYGRSRNPTASGVGGARINKLSALVSLCDMPAAWETREPTAFRDGGNPAAASLVATLSGPSLAVDGTITRVAFGDAGGILLGTLEADGVHLETATRITSDSALPWQAEGLGDPALLPAGAHSAEVYFTAHGADGVDRIGVARADGTGGFTLDSVPALEPGDFPGFTNFSQPTVLEHGGSTTLLIVHAEDAEGTHLEAFYSDTGLAFTRIENGNLPQLTQAGSADADADEVLEPNLVLFDHAWHLYVTLRQGARYHIGLLASDELLAWRWVEPEALIAKGDASDFDGLGVRSPATLPNGDAVEMFYVGLDGATATIGRTRRVANAGTGTP